MEKQILIVTSLICPVPGKAGAWESNLSGMTRAAAAGELYHQFVHDGESAKVIISGGKINGEHNPSLSDVLASEMHGYYRVPNIDILAESKAVDTPDNAELTANFLRERQMPLEGFLVTNKYHMRRTAFLFERYGVKVEKIIAEEYLRSIGKHIPLVEEFERSREARVYPWVNLALEAITHMPYGEKVLRRYVHWDIKRHGGRTVV